MIKEQNSPAPPRRTDLQWHSTKQQTGKILQEFCWERTFSVVTEFRYLTENAGFAPWQNCSILGANEGFGSSVKLCSVNEETFWMNSFMANPGIRCCFVWKSPRSSNFYCVWNFKMCEVFSVLSLKNGKLEYFATSLCCFNFLLLLRFKIKRQEFVYFIFILYFILFCWVSFYFCFVLFYGRISINFMTLGIFFRIAEDVF